MIELRRVESDEDIEAFLAVRRDLTPADLVDLGGGLDG